MFRISLFNELCRVVENDGLREIIKGKLQFPTASPSIHHLLSEAKLFYFQEKWDEEYGPETERLSTVMKQWDGLWDKFRLPFQVTAIETPKDVVMIADLSEGQIGLKEGRLLLHYRAENAAQAIICGGMFENFRWDPSDPTGLDFRATRGIPFAQLIDRKNFIPLPAPSLRKMVSSIAIGQTLQLDPFLVGIRENTFLGLPGLLPQQPRTSSFTHVTPAALSAKKSPMEEYALDNFMDSFLPYGILKVAHISNPTRFVVERMPNKTPIIQKGKVARGGERSVYILLDLKYIKETLGLGQPVQGSISNRSGGPRRAHWRRLLAECYHRGPDNMPRAIEIKDHWVGRRQGLWQGMVYIVRPEI